MAAGDERGADGASEERAARDGLRSIAVCALIATLLAALNYLLFGREGLNMRDEGYLWYGVRAVLAGEIPLRDFQAYDPGRYYWCAAWTPLVGDGVLGVRIASAAFQVLGLTAGLLAARRALCCDWALPFVGVLLLAWMFPRHKLFESSITMIGVLAAVRLIERPTRARHVAAGLVVGAMAFVGRNHGLYLGVGLGALVVWLALRARGADRDGADDRALVEHARARRFARLAGFALGVVVGYVPMIALMLFADGFFTGFVDATLLLLDQGANLPLAYPWPWAHAIDGEGLEAVAEVGYVAAFAIPVVVYPLAAWAAVGARRTAASGQGAERIDGRFALLVACLFVGVPYAHHFAVRSDLSHLAQAIHPALLALVALPLGLVRSRALASTSALALLTLLTVPIQVRRHPAITEELRENDAETVVFEIDEDELEMRFPLARHLDRVREMNRQIVGDDELFIAPTSPTFYPLLHKRSPDWWIYYLWPASEEQQRETIRRIDERGVNWALIVEKSFDADESYSFRETNPLVMEHLEREFETVEDFLVPPKYVLLRRRGSR